MDDQMEISSTTPSHGFQHDDDEEEYSADKYENSLMDNEADLMEREADAKDPDGDSILDLVGGAEDALERHRSTLPRTEEPPLLDFTDPEPASTSKPEPEAVKPAPTSASGGATAKPTKSEEKEEKPSVTPSKSKSCCSYERDGFQTRMYLDKDFGISSELAHKYGDTALAHFNSLIKELRRLFLVEDLVDSLKFAVLMWILTYVGALFNGLTLLILGLIGAFSWPVIYEKHQAQIDHYYGLVNKQIKDVFG
ncbi:hypothetical protein cypCar_00015615, partial [Cyprinus carpio]